LLSGREGDDRPLWQASTNEARLTVTDGGPLEEGKKYRWRVYALEEGGEERVLLESHFFICASEEVADLARLVQLAASSAPGDWLLAAAVYEGYGVYDQALSLYERLAKEVPEAAEVQVALACYYRRAGRPEKAKEARERAEKLGAEVPAR
jgi:tetratricopeptide (TPR) repeat protein